MAAPHRLFPQWVISRFGDVPWPPRSLNLRAPGCFLWGYFKSKVYSSLPIDFNALKQTM